MEKRGVLLCLGPGTEVTSRWREQDDIYRSKPTQVPGCNRFERVLFPCTSKEFGSRWLRALDLQSRGPEFKSTASAKMLDTAHMFIIPVFGNGDRKIQGGHWAAS